MEQQVYRSPNAHRKPPKRRRPRWGRIGGVLLALALVAVAALFLPQMLRGKAPVDDPATPDSPVGQDTAQTDTPSPDDTATVQSTAAQGDLITLMTGENTYLRRFSDDGFYYLTSENAFANGLPGQNIKYIDFATQSELFLCSTPSCAHNTEECPSYFAGYAGNCYLFVVYDHLCLIKLNDGLGPDRIEIRDLDGSNARTVLTMGDGESIRFTDFAADREHIYYTHYVSVNEGGSLITKQYLEGVDIQTKEVTRVCKLPEKDFFIGTCGSYFLLRQIVDDNLVMHAVDKQGNEITGLGLPAGFDPLKQFSYVSDEGAIYQIEYGDPTVITAYDVLAGTQRTVTDSFPATRADTSWFSAPVDGVMLCLATQDGATQSDFYLLHLDDGSYQPFSLLRNSGGKQTNVSFVAAYNDLLLVQTSDKATSPAMGQGNDAGFLEPPYPIYALITKDDYFNSRPNYIEITQVG